MGRRFRVAINEVKNSDKTMYALLKLVDKESHANDFVKGNIRFSTLRSFKEYPDVNGEMRGDPCEGIISWLQPENIQVTIAGITAPSSDLASAAYIHSNALLDSRCSCLYAMHSGNFEKITEETLYEFQETLKLHQKSFGLGDYVVLIHNFEEFKKRVVTAFSRNQSCVKMSFVNYFDDKNHHERLDPKFDGFHKRNLFKHQNEYRILTDELVHIDGDPKILNVGDLSDITEITTPKKFNAKLSVSLPENNSI
jgi:hypothetical protein